MESKSINVISRKERNALKRNLNPLNQQKSNTAVRKRTSIAARMAITDQNLNK